ncbi:MAG: LysM peptidoglycan-binding domain-containing protein [Candidatus Glassbacteria bacterium]
MKKDDSTYMRKPCIFITFLIVFGVGCASIVEKPRTEPPEPDKAETSETDRIASGGDTDAVTTSSIIEKIEASENAYNESMVRYELGDLEASRELHEKAFSLLLEAKLESIKDPAAHEILQEAIDELYASLSRRFQELSQPMEHELWASSEELNNAADSIPSIGGKAQLEFPIDSEQELVKKYLRLFKEGNRRKFLEESLRRSGRYKDMIIGELKTKGMPKELWVIPVIESGYKISAYSRKRAAGLWQFIPSTARHYGLTINEWLDERRDPVKSTRAALTFLEELYEWFNSWELALAAYNRGANNISSDIHNSKMVDFFEIAKHNMTHTQTKNFVPQIQAAILITEYPEEYGFSIEYDDPITPDVITIDYVVDLSVVAKCVGTTEDEIRELNPELRTWVTPVLSKDYPTYDLKLPQGTRNLYLQEIAKITDLTPDRRVRYIVKRGDTLGEIARRFGVSWRSIKKWNNIRGTTIYPGQSLYIRPGKGWTGSSRSIASRKAPSWSDDYVVYKIRKGDTLSKIAEDYNVSVRDLKQWNGIRNSRKIRPGQKLRIYISGESS